MPPPGNSHHSPLCYIWVEIPEGIIPDAKKITQRMAPHTLLCCEDQIKGQITKHQHQFPVAPQEAAAKLLESPQTIPQQGQELRDGQTPPDRTAWPEFLLWNTSANWWVCDAVQQSRAPGAHSEHKPKAWCKLSCWNVLSGVCASAARPAKTAPVCWDTLCQEQLSPNLMKVKSGQKVKSP